MSIKPLGRLVRLLKHPGVTASVARGASAAMIVKVSGFAAAYVTQVLLARWMGIDAYGSYAWVFNNAALIATFTGLGFYSAVVRFIPEYRSQQAWGLLRGLMQVSLMTVLSVAGLLALVGGFLIWGIGIELRVASSHALILGILSVPLLAMLEYYRGVLKAWRRMILAMAPAAVIRRVLLILGVFAIKVLYPEMPITAELVLMVVLGSLVLTVITQIISLRTVVPDAYRDEPQRIRKTKEWIRVALPMLLVTGFLTLLNRIDLLLIGSFLERADVGLYHAAFKTTNLISFVIISVNAITGPTVASLYAQGQLKALRTLLKRIAHGIFWPTLFLSLVLALLSEWVLGFFGQEFREGTPLMLLLIGAQLFNAASGSVGLLLSMTGHQDYTARVYGWSVIVKLLLSLIGVSLLGVMGVAIATAATIVFQNLWLRHLNIKHLQLDPSIFGVLYKRSP